MARDKKYSGGYQVAKSLNVTVPDKIKCIRCKKLKGRDCYANNRIDELKVEISENKNSGLPTSEVIPCGKCTGGPMVEMECSRCDTVYGLDKFSKAQRKNPDEAVCWKCMQDRLNEDDASSSSGGGDTGDDSDGSDDDIQRGTTTAATFSNLSLTGGSSSAGGVALNSTAGSVNGSTYSSSTIGHGSINAPGSTTTSRSPDGHIPLHRRNRSPSSVASSSVTTPTRNDSGFAKVRAKPTKQDTAAARRVREFDETQKRNQALEKWDADVEVQSSASDTD